MTRCAGCLLALQTIGPRLSARVCVRVCATMLDFLGCAAKPGKGVLTVDLQSAMVSCPKGVPPPIFATLNVQVKLSHVWPA